jgi:hypothetical protein
MTHPIGRHVADHPPVTTQASAPMRLPAGEVTFHPSSFQDRHGRLFFWEGGLYRGINPDDAGFYRQVLERPLISSLCDRKLLIPTELADVTSEHWPLLLRHATVPFVTYPFEWCGAMLRDAALLVIDIMRSARRRPSEPVVLRESSMVYARPVRSRPPEALSLGGPLRVPSRATRAVPLREVGLARGAEGRAPGHLPFLPGTAGVGCALARASAFFWLFSAASCFFRRSFDFGDLSPMDHRLRFG